MRRFLVLVLAAAALLSGCERSVRAVALADEPPGEQAVAPVPEHAIADLLRIEIPSEERVARSDDGSEVVFAWPDGRTLRLRELGDVRTAGRRADYTAQFSLREDEPPLLCRL